MSDHLPLHLLGTQGFLPALLSHIRTLASSTPLPLDPVIFQSILLCLIAGDKHLILRTPDEDVGLTVKLAVWTLSFIFNLHTHKLKIRNKPSARSINGITSSADPAVFLRSLFLPSGTSSNPNQTSQDEGSGEHLKHFGHHRQQPHSRPSRQKAKHPEYSRSRSFPNNLAGAAQTHITLTSPDALVIRTTVPNPELANPANIRPRTSPSILKPQPTYPLGVPHAYTDPLPSHQRNKSLTQSKPVLQLPQALVISGLENASDSMQRSLAMVLADRRVVLEGLEGINMSEINRGKISRSLSARDDEDGVWNLPEGFVTIYVCPWNARERPAIHKTLLDKFAMSTNVFIPQNIRRDFHSLPFTPAPRPFQPNLVSQSSPGSPSPSYPTSLPQTHTPPIFTKPLPSIHRYSHVNQSPLPEEVIPRAFIKTLQDACQKAHISHTLSLYLSDIFSATRHHSRLDAMLLTARSVTDAEDLIRASRVIGNDLTGMELARPPVHIDDNISAENSQSQDGISKDYVHLGPGDQDSTAASTYNRHTQQETAVIGILDVSEVDIARIVPRVISHRVRLRNGPENEVLSSALFGATFETPIPNLSPDEEARNAANQMDSVKAVLVNILSEV